MSMHLPKNPPDIYPTNPVTPALDVLIPMKPPSVTCYSFSLVFHFLQFVRIQFQLDWHLAPHKTAKQQIFHVYFF